MMCGHAATDSGDVWTMMTKHGQGNPAWMVQMHVEQMFLLLQNRFVCESNARVESNRRGKKSQFRKNKFQAYQRCLRGASPASRRLLWPNIYTPAGPGQPFYRTCRSCWIWIALQLADKAMRRHNRDSQRTGLQPGFYWMQMQTIKPYRPCVKGKVWLFTV